MTWAKVGDVDKSATVSANQNASLSDSHDLGATAPVEFQGTDNGARPGRRHAGLAGQPVLGADHADERAVVIVKGTNPNAVTVAADAAILALSPSGTSGSPGTGYIKAYEYDDRLRYTSPPQFPGPGQGRLGRPAQSEQAPAS